MALHPPTRSASNAPRLIPTRAGVALAIAASLASATAYAQPTASAPLRRAEQILAPHPDLARLVARAQPGDGFVAQDGALVSAGWRDARASRLDRLGVQLPERLDGVVDVRLGRSEQHRLGLHLVGARGGATAELHEGRVVFADAYRATDAILTSTPFRFEELLLLRSADAPRAFSWRVDLPSAVAGVEREPSLGSLLFYDARHDGLFRVLRPVAVDAKGTRRDAELAWEGGAVTVRLDTKGLVFPILLDPATEPAVWQQRCTDDACKANQPSPRSRVAMDYDEDKQAMLTFGGWGGNGIGLSDSKTWSWDGARWTLRTDGVPSPRSRHWIVDDKAAAQMMMFGGSTLENLTDDTGWTNETWLWSGRWSQWTGNAPPPLMGFGLAYDTKRGQGVLFGGLTKATVVLDGGAVGGSVDAGDAGNDVDAGDGGDAGGATDSGPATTDAGGGGGGPTYVVEHSRDTWIWDGRNGGSWTKAPVSPDASPPPRRFFGMAYDSARDEVVLFGGEVQFEKNYFNGKYGRWNDTWVWKDGAWTQRHPAHSPSPRGTVYMAYDASRKVVVLFGGYGTSNDPPTCPPCDFYGDTWEWDGNDWTQIDVTGPSARNSQGIAYDPNRQRVVMFGGYIGSADAPTNEVWEYGPPRAEGTCAVDADCASTTGHCVDGVCCASATCGECARCDDPASRGTCTPVSDGTTCGGDGGVCQAGSCGPASSAASASPSGGGCGCHAIGGDAGSGAAMLAGVGAAVAAIRRRRRRRA